MQSATGNPKQNTTLPGQVLKGLAVASAAQESFPPGRSKRKANDAGGHLNQKTKEQHKDVVIKVRMKLGHSM